MSEHSLLWTGASQRAISPGGGERTEPCSKANVSEAVHRGIRVTGQGWGVRGHL